MSKMYISSIEQFESEWARTFRPKFDSSAAELEKLLYEQNIISNIKIFHKYRLPENLTPEEFEKKLKKIWGHLTFDQDMAKNSFNIDSNTIKELRKSRLSYFIILKSWAEYIKKNNPELSNIDAKNQKNLLALVDGACYGFGPEDIKFFIFSRDDNKINFETDKKNTDLEELINNPISYKISKNRVEKLISCVRTQKNFNRYMEWRESKGMGDD